MLLNICDEPSSLEIIMIVSIVINLLRTIIPLVLILDVIYDFIKFFVKLWDFEVQNTFKKFFKNAIISLLIYFIPLIISFILVHLAPQYNNCINVNNDLIQKLYINHAKERISNLNESSNISDINEVKNIINNIKNNNIKVNFLDKIENLESKINSNNYFNDNYSGNIYIGDSRTVGLKNVLLDNEKKFAISGGKTQQFIINAEETKKELSKNPNKTYNIILNYGVNDLIDAYDYCSLYTDFIKEIEPNHRIYLVSVNPVNDEKTKAQNYSIEQFNNILKSCTEKLENVNYCDVYNSTTMDDWLDNYISKDGLHYTEKGYEYIHSKILSCIK